MTCWCHVHADAGSRRPGHCSRFHSTCCCWIIINYKMREVEVELVSSFLFAGDLGVPACTVGDLCQRSPACRRVVTNIYLDLDTALDH